MATSDTLTVEQIINPPTLSPNDPLSSVNVYPKFVMDSKGHLIGLIDTFDPEKYRLAIGSVQPQHINKLWFEFDRGVVDLSRTEGRLSDNANLPEEAEELVSQKASYLTSRQPFEISDWSANQATLYVPLTHAFYNTYADDGCPSVLVFERIGVTTPYQYELVITDYSIEKSFRSAKIIGSTSATSNIATWQAILFGKFRLLINGTITEVSGLNFSTDTTLDQVATRITNALNGLAVCAYVTDHFEIECVGSSGITSITFLSDLADVTGNDISGPYFLAMNQGQVSIIEGIWDGWMVVLTHDSLVSDFPGVIQVM